MLAAVLLPISVAGTAGTAASQEAGRAPWPMAGRDAPHSGSADGPAPPYRQAWARPVGFGGPVVGPVVAGGAVVVVAARGVVALDPGSGEILWEMERSEGPAGPPVVVGNLVVHASGSGSRSSLVARVLGDGIEAWRAFIGSDLPGGLVAADGVVYAGTVDGLVVAVDGSTGEERWRFEAEGAVEATPAVSGGFVLVATEERQTGGTTLYALDAASGPGSGPPTWRFSPPSASAPAASPASDGRRAFLVTSDGAVRALDLETGGQAWAAEARATVSARQVPAAGSQLVVADRLHLYGLDPVTGDERWVFRLADLRALPGGRPNTLAASSAAVTGGAAVIGDASGLLSAVDLATGRRVWRGDVGSGPVGGVAVGPDLVFVASLGKEGSVVGLAHDADARLLDEVSPTTVFPVRAALNFLVAFVIVGVVILGLSRLALRGRRVSGPTQEGER